jgi:hypothetical protein
MRRLSLIFFFALATLSRADPLPPLTASDPAWSDLVALFADRPDAAADFSEKRFFPFRRTPLELSGVSRYSTTRGLSLDYTTPEKRTVILDSQGMLMRQRDGEADAPGDPRATAANAALIHVLRFDLTALALNFDLFGQRDGEAWTLAVVPRAPDLRQAVSDIVVTGQSAEVRRIVIRRSAKQYVEITVGAARLAPFTPEELKRFFR